MNIVSVEHRIGLQPGMVARFEGGVLYSGNRVVARTVVQNYAGGGFDLRLSTEAAGGIPLPSGMAGMGNRLPEIRDWIVRHPEALAVRRPSGRVGGDPRWACWQWPHRPVAERVPALVVRERDPATGKKVLVEVNPSYVRMNPYYVPLAGPVGPLP